MEVTIKRLVHIIAAMAFNGVELCNDIANEECYIFMGYEQKALPLSYEELHSLLEADIIEVDSGCDEVGYERKTYRLTHSAFVRVQTLVDEYKKQVKNRKRL